MKKLQNFIIYFLIGFGVLGFIILRAGLENDNNLFSVIGIVVMLTAVILGLIHLGFLNSKAKKAIGHYEKVLSEFKSNSIKIPVDLDKVHVSSKSWTETSEIDGYPADSFYMGVLDSLGGYDNRNFTTETININTLLINVNHNGRQINYAVDVEKDPMVLAMKFAIQKETNLYVSKSDESKFYLDLEFLD